MYVGIRAVNDQVNIYGLPEFDVRILQPSGQEVEDVDPVLATGPEHGRQVIGQAIAPGEPSSDHGVLPSDKIHRVKAEVRLDDVLHHLFVVTRADCSVDKTANSVEVQGGEGEVKHASTPSGDVLIQHGKNSLSEFVLRGELGGTGLGPAFHLGGCEPDDVVALR
ncbi:hypothetical protein PG996_007919 [Apiospora saccharicola]|uniref:Uncharacterized protein n=1 Tax=Apiospora saccharicola TaxID=335842 RepID=A0ABR1UWH9_9PEZI